MPDQGSASNNGHRSAGILFGRPGSFRLALSPNDSAPARARRALAELGGDLDPELRERSAVVLSELVTNSFKHGGLSESQRIHVEVSLRPELIRMQVMDPGKGFDTVALRRGHVDRTGGWGFWLIDEMSDRWGVDCSHSTNIWCEFDRA
jgi:anti-sigma regulatory factor (Ser/Thr protein kinase)